MVMRYLMPRLSVETMLKDVLAAANAVKLEDYGAAWA
jgi:hypothetical protein